MKWSYSGIFLRNGRVYDAYCCKGGIAASAFTLDGNLVACAHGYIMTKLQELNPLLEEGRQEKNGSRCFGACRVESNDKAMDPLPSPKLYLLPQKRGWMFVAYLSAQASTKLGGF